MLLNLVLAALLVGPLELRGLALALSVATCVEFLVLAVLAARQIPAMLEGSLLAGIGRIIVACIALGLATGASLAIMVYGLDFDLEATARAFLVLIVSAAAGGLAYLGCSLFLGLDEARDLMRRVLDRGGPAELKPEQ
jgi:peptidoglycan biosynthesis protein MviN/MurJ (putative lipid II flippase)